MCFAGFVGGNRSRCFLRFSRHKLIYLASFGVGWGELPPPPRAQQFSQPINPNFYEHPQTMCRLSQGCHGDDREKWKVLPDSSLESQEVFQKEAQAVCQHRGVFSVLRNSRPRSRKVLRCQRNLINYSISVVCVRTDHFALSDGCTVGLSGKIAFGDWTVPFPRYVSHRPFLPTIIRFRTPHAALPTQISEPHFPIWTRISNLLSCIFHLPSRFQALFSHISHLTSHVSSPKTSS